MRWLGRAGEVLCEGDRRLVDQTKARSPNTQSERTRMRIREARRHCQVPLRFVPSRGSGDRGEGARAGHDGEMQIAAHMH